MDKKDKKVYTFLLMSGVNRKMIKVEISAFAVRFALGIAAAVATTLGLLGVAFSHMLHKVNNYNELKSEHVILREKYLDLKTNHKETGKKLNSLQSLAREVAVSYDVTKKRPSRRGDSAHTESLLAPQMLPAITSRYEASVYAYGVLKSNYNPTALSGPQPVLFTEDEYTEIFNQPTSWPARGFLSGHFGQRIDPFLGKGRFHAGIDIIAPMGASVSSPADGLVVFSGQKIGYGNVVMINHGNGTSTRLAHLSKISVSLGWQVKRGQAIGNIGSTGRSTGPHLHYETLVNEVPVNPLKFLRAPRNRQPEGVKISLVALNKTRKKCLPASKRLALAKTKLARANRFANSAAGL